MATNLLTSFVRRINKFFLSEEASWYRPNAAAPGTNHIDDPSLFGEETIYRGETIIDLNTGKQYTQDGAEILEVGAVNGVVQGMSLSKSATQNYIKVGDGSVRTMGKTYWFKSSGADLLIANNPETNKVRIDIIAAQSNYPTPADPSQAPTGSTEYAAGLTAIQGGYYADSRSISFFGSVQAIGPNALNTTIRFSAGPQSVQGINVGDEIVGPGLPQGIQVTAVDPNGYFIETSYVNPTNITNGKYFIPYGGGSILKGFTGTISAGGSQITGVYPINTSLANSLPLIISEALPPGTRVTSINTNNNTVNLSKNALVSYSGLFQVGDAADEMQYPSNTNGWPNLGTGQVLLGFVVVPAGFSVSSTPKARPISVPKTWQNPDVTPYSPQDYLNYLRSTNTYYDADASYVSDQIVIDRNYHAAYQVVASHYSTSIDNSLNSGYLAKVGGAGAINGLPGPAGPTGPAGEISSLQDGQNGQVFTYDDSLSPPYGWATGTNVITYTNANAMPASVGGWDANSIFSAVPLQDLLTGLLYPYQAPTFNNTLDIDGSDAPIYESGQTFTSAPTIIASVSNYSNVANPPVNYTIYTSLTGATASGGNIASVGTAFAALVGLSGVVSNTSNSYTAILGISGTNSKNAIFSDTVTLTWRKRGFALRSLQTSITGGNLGTATATKSGLYANAKGIDQVDFPADSTNKYLYFAFPTSFGTATSASNSPFRFKNVATGGDVTPSFISVTGTFTYTNPYGATATYRYYRLDNEAQGAIAIQIY